MKLSCISHLIFFLLCLCSLQIPKTLTSSRYQEPLTTSTWPQWDLRGQHFFLSLTRPFSNGLATCLPHCQWAAIPEIRPIHLFFSTTVMKLSSMLSNGLCCTKINLSFITSNHPNHSPVGHMWGKDKNLHFIDDSCNPQEDKWFAQEHTTKSPDLRVLSCFIMDVYSGWCQTIKWINPHKVGIIRLQ